MASKPVFSPDGNSIAWNGSEIWVYDIKTKEKRAPFKKLKGSSNLAFTTKGKLLAADLDGGPKEYNLSVWDSDTGNKQTFLNAHSDSICCTAFSADGKVVASAGWDHTVRLWDIATGKNTAVYKDQPGFVYALAFSPDGKIAAAGFKPRLDSNKDGGVRLYDTATGKVLADLTGYTTPVGTLAFSPDGKLLATDGLEGKIRIWTIPEVWTAGK
jgi:WD40 repeat protein